MNSFIDYGVEKLLDHATSSDQGKQKDRILKIQIQTWKAENLLLAGLVKVSPFNKLSNEGKKLLKSGLKWEKYQIETEYIGKMRCQIGSILSLAVK